MRLARKYLQPYSCAKSPHRFTQAHLMTCLVLRAYLKSTYRGVIEKGRGKEYPSQKVFILKTMTHEEYDKDKWKDECGCFEPPPKKSMKSVRKSTRPKRKR